MQKKLDLLVSSSLDQLNAQFCGILFCTPVFITLNMLPAIKKEQHEIQRLPFYTFS